MWEGWGCGVERGASNQCAESRGCIIRRWNRPCHVHNDVDGRAILDPLAALGLGGVEYPSKPVIALLASPKRHTGLDSSSRAAAAVGEEDGFFRATFTPQGRAPLAWK